MADFGGKLRQARERRGVSLRQVSIATKISIGVLEALERNDLSKLPGGIFSRAFIRSYAIEVGLDPDETIRDFLVECPADSTGAPPPPPRPSSAPAKPKPAQGSRSVFVAADHARRTPAPPREPGADESEFESQQRMATVVLRLVLVSIPIVLMILYFSVPPSTQSGSGRPRRAQEPPPVASDLPASGTGQAPPSAPASALPAPSNPLPAPAAQGTQTLELRPTGPCWVSLRVDGAPSLTRTLQAGERESRAFRDEAVLTVGDAAACQFALNGQAARPLGGAGQARTVRITRQNLSSYLP
jgi:cytoskeleton protein RodZ